MKQGRTDKDWAVVAVMTFGAGALIAWALLSKHPPQPRPQADIDWPAWVQAVGSVLAIVAAIAIAWWQQKQNQFLQAARDAEAELGRHVRANRIFERFQKKIERQLKEAESLGEQGGKIEALPLPDEILDLEKEMYLLPSANSASYTTLTSFEAAQDLIHKGTVSVVDHPNLVFILRMAQAQCALALKGIRQKLETR